MATIDVRILIYATNDSKKSDAYFDELSEEIYQDLTLTQNMVDFDAAIGVLDEFIKEKYERIESDVSEINIIIKGLDNDLGFCRQYLFSNEGMIIKYLKEIPEVDNEPEM